MNYSALNVQQTSVMFIVCLWLAGCTESVYQRMNDPARDGWQKPQVVITKLAIEPGSRVADLGAGGGYFAGFLAKAVGPKGTVYAVDINDDALDFINKEMKSRGITNVLPIRAEPNDPKLPELVDLVFSCNTYHHMKDRSAYFKSLSRYLKPNGRVAIVDFHPHGIFFGFLGHGTAKEDVRREMESAGYRLIADYDVIDRQHFQMFIRE
ncbi:MAG: methyltransferase domain-containing protein [Burkholderiales bacterium]|nr:methyltransferase domain-containing protein [Burkholderiales bacterium]MDR4517149.1 class I SAM-dependent methyltransferase [Nitrosomonas sp.]